MDFYGFLWISMDFYGFLWISMDFYGFLWISTIQILLHMDYASPTSSHIQHVGYRWDPAGYWGYRVTPG